MIDRGSIRAWQEAGAADAAARLRQRVEELAVSYRQPALGAAARRMQEVVERSRKAN